MKRKGMKKILVLIMALVMLFGNVLTVSAEETESDGFKSNYVCITSVYTPKDGEPHTDVFVLNTSDESIEICAVETEGGNGTEIVNKMIQFYVVGWEDASWGTWDFAYNYPYASQTRTFPSGSIADQHTSFYKEIYDPDYGEVRYSVNAGSYKLFETFDELKTYASTKTGDYEVVSKPVSDSSLAEFDENLDFINLRFKEINGAPVIHTITWEANENYDENTYVTVHCDIKYKPVLGSLNSYSDYGYLTRFDEYPATSLNFTCECNEPVIEYFETAGIDYHSFNTQWVDCYYLQVLKYHPDTDAWTKSNVWYVDCGSQTTGMSTVFETGTAVKDPTTGEYIKDKVNIGNGTSGEYVGGIIEDIYDDIGDTSDVGSYFTGVWKAFITGFSSLVESIGDIPSMVASVVSFLPGGVITLIGSGVVVVILLRVLGR